MNCWNKIVLIILVSSIAGSLSMTRQQIKNSGKLIKKTCMPKNNVTEEMVGSIEQGKFLDTRNVMCYIACVFATSAVIRNNQLINEAMVKQVDMMFPKELKEASKAALENCKDVAKHYKDICEASYWTAKCMYDFNPAAFLFP